MKRVVLLVLLLSLLSAVGLADKARFLSSDGNRSFHSSHLESHVGLIDCRVSANYLKVRTSAGSSGSMDIPSFSSTGTKFPSEPVPG